MGYLIDLGKHGLDGLKQNAGLLRPGLRGVIDRCKAVSELYSMGVQVANKFRTVKVDALNILSKAVGSRDLDVSPIAIIVGGCDDQILAIAVDVLESKLHTTA